MRTFLFIIVLLCSKHIHAQVPGVKKITSIVPKVMFGIKAGATFDQLSSSSTWSQSYVGGITGGAFLGFHGKRMGIQVEGLIHSARFNASLSSSQYITTLNLDVPLLLEYKIVPRIWIQLGPQFTDVLSVTDHSTGLANSFSSTDFSAVAGLQFILPLHLVVGARYVFGFTNQYNNSTTGINTDWENRQIQLHLGLRFM